MALNWDTLETKKEKKSTLNWDELNIKNSYTPTYKIVESNMPDMPESYYNKYFDENYPGMSEKEILEASKKQYEERITQRNAKRAAQQQKWADRNEALAQVKEARDKERLAQEQAIEEAKRQQAQEFISSVTQQGTNVNNVNMHNNPTEFYKQQAQEEKALKEKLAEGVGPEEEVRILERLNPGKKYYVDYSSMAWEKPNQVKEKNILNDISNIAENFFTGMFGGTGTAIEYVNKVYNKVTGNKSDWSNYEKISNDIANTQYSNTNNNTNSITKKISELSPSIGQSTLALMYTAITGNPKVGSTVFGLSAAGGYYELAKQKGLNEEQALIFGGILGTLEGVTENILTTNRLKGLKAFQNKQWQQLLNSFGASVTENFIQEAVMEPLQEATTMLVGGEANWDNIWQRAITAGVDGALMEILMSGATAGLGTSTTILNKIQNNKSVSATEIQDMVKEAKKSGINVKDIFADALKAATTLTVQENSGTKMMAVTQWENNQPVGGQVMQGLKVKTNNKIKADIAVVQTETGYMAIDANTGLQLDTEKATQEEAINSVKSKINSMDKQSVEQINNRLFLAETKIQAEIRKYEAEENAIKTVNATKQKQVGQIQDLTSKTTNYMSQSENRLEIENNAKSKGIVEIKDNIYNNIAKRKQDSVLNKHLKNNVKGQDYYVDGQKIMATKHTLGKLRYGNTLFDNKIDKNIRKELKANVIANIKNIVETSKIYQADRKDTKNHEFADTFDRRKSYFSYKGQNYEIMFEVGKKDGKNTLYGIEHIKKISNSLSQDTKVSKSLTKSDDPTVPNKSIAEKSNIVKSNERRNQNGEKRLTHNGQETNRNNKGENSERKGIDEKDNGSAQKELSKGLRNYEEERKRKLGQDFKAEIIEGGEQSSNEKIVSKGFKEATGLDINMFKTNKNITEAAFYSNNGIFVKHNPLSSKKAANFKPFHEYGHWLKNNRNASWKKIYNIVDKTITQKQIDDYKKVINDQNIFETMSKAEIREFVINEIISDYVGNWANNVENWLPYIEQQKISQEYAEFLADIALENKEYGYNVFGTLEQQEQVLAEITKIMRDAIEFKANNYVLNEEDMPFSNRSDLNEQDFFDIKKGIWYNKNGIELVIKERLSQAIDEDTPRWHKGLHGKFFMDSFFVVDKLGHNSYKVIMQVQIENNEVLINELRKELKNATFKRPKTVDTIIQSFRYGRRNDYTVDGSDTRRKENESSNKLHLGDNRQGGETEQRQSRQKSNGNRNDRLENSNKSSFIMPKNDIFNTDRRDLEENSKSYTDEDLNQRIKERQEIAKMIKERKFFQNVYKSDVPAEFKAELLKNRKQYEYEPISNKDTLDKAMATIRNTNNIKDVFLENDLKTAEDTAIGEVLIQQAMKSGDYKEANSLTASLAEKLTNAGQIIQAAAMFRRMTPEGMLLFAEKKTNQINKEIEKKFKLNKLLTKKNAPKIKMTEEKIQFINSLMKEMQELEEKKQNTKNGTVLDVIEREEDVIIAKIVAKIGEDIPTTMTDKLASWRNISLLLNTKTIMRNLVSNAMFSSIENLVDVVGVPLDRAIALVTGERSLLLPNMKTQAKGFKKGLDYAIYDTKEGISTSLGGNKYDIKATSIFKNELLKRLETASYFGVEGLDRTFMQAKYESALEMLMKLEGLKYGRDIAPDRLKEQALEMAKYTTFKDRNAISDILSKVKRTLNANKAIGAADILGLTYTNVPGNLTKKAIDYSPVGLYNVIRKASELKIKRADKESTRQTQRELVQATSRFLIGTGIMAVSVQAFLAGVLTASGEEEDEKVKALTDQENYAINISAFLRWITGGKTDKKNGDLYVTYSNYEPLSSMIAAATEMTGAAKEGDNSSTIVYKGLTSWINCIAELSTISNFSSLFEYGDLGGSLTRSLSQFPASFIPTTAKQIAQLFETNSKANYSDNFVERYLINPIRQRTPGVISTLESYYDTMGNEEESYNGSKGLARLYDVFLNTSYTSTVDMDATEQELYDLYLSTGSTDHLPLQVKNYFTYKGETINLTSKEKAEYQKQLGQKTAKAFKEKMTTREYKNMTDSEKVDTLKSIINEINQEVKSDVVLEPRGLAYDARFSAGESLNNNGYKLILTEAMKKEYEQIASKKYQQYEKTGLYSEEKLKELKTKSKEYAKQQLMQKYKSKVIKSK